MKQQAFNPYLPGYEYIPDAEPRVFGDRVYIYGSHDRFNWPIFCLNDYVCWSAPLDDLSDWRYEGVIYRKNQDPMNKLGLRCLYAPDAVQGPDGRFYLYYAFDFMGVMGVAAADKPEGPFEFYGHVRFADGHRWGSRSGEPFPFDPGVLVDDDGRVYLYSGFATKTPAIASRGRNLTNPGGVVLELERDMLTVKDGPTLLFPRKGNGAPAEFEGHEFFEASSIRKVNGRYAFVYSSAVNHELCYAMSDSPRGPFAYGGVLVSLGDVGLPGAPDASRARDYLGNTHGGMVELCGTWYIFYHRQTNRHSYSRQACAEPLVRTEDGRFLQAERSSCGLNGGPLKDLGFYPAAIACNLYSKTGAARIDMPFSRLRLRTHPYFTQRGRDGDTEAVQYIRNMRDGAVAGFKSFAFREPRSVRVTVSGKGKGVMQVFTTEDFSAPAASIPLHVDHEIVNAEGKLDLSPGVRPLYFRYIGKGSIDFYSFDLI